MRRYLLIPLFIGMIWGQSSSQSTKNEIITERHQNGLKKNVMVFEGEGLSEIKVAEYGFYDNGLKAFIKNFNNNLLNGISIAWHSNGKKREEGYFDDGKKIGVHQTWYSNGILNFTAHFIDDTLNGNYISYFSDGKEKIKGQYISGKKNGKWIEYDLQDNKWESTYVNGKLNGLFTKHNKIGKILIRGIYKDDKKEGVWKNLVSSGAYNQTTFKQDIMHGVATIIQPDGIKKKGVYNNNQKDGTWNHWHKNGNKKATLTYALSMLPGNYVLSKLQGYYALYDEDGVIYESGNYKDNEKLGFVYFYNKNGTIRERWKYEKKKKKNSSYVVQQAEITKITQKQIFEYYANGNIKSETNLDELGRKIGKWIVFHQDFSIDTAIFYHDSIEQSIIDAVEKKKWKLEEYEKFGYELYLKKTKLKQEKIAKEAKLEQERIAKEAKLEQKKIRVEKASREAYQSDKLIISNLERSCFLDFKIKAIKKFKKNIEPSYRRSKENLLKTKKKHKYKFGTNYKNGVNLKGYIMDDVINGKPIENVIVELETKGRLPYRLLTDKKGRFNFRNIKRREYYITFKHPDFGFKNYSWTGKKSLVDIKQNKKLDGIVPKNYMDEVDAIDWTYEWEMEKLKYLMNVIDKNDVKLSKPLTRSYLQKLLADL